MLSFPAPETILFFIACVASSRRTMRVVFSARPVETVSPSTGQLSVVVVIHHSPAVQPPTQNEQGRLRENSTGGGFHFHPFWASSARTHKDLDTGGSGGSYMATRPRCVFPGLLCLHMGPLGRRRLGLLSLWLGFHFHPQSMPTSSNSRLPSTTPNGPQRWFIGKPRARAFQRAISEIHRASSRSIATCAKTDGNGWRMGRETAAACTGQRAAG